MRKYLVTTIHLSKGVLLSALVMLLTFSGIIPVVGQNTPELKFKHYGLDHGLSQVTAICLLEDQQGYIWVGTQDGLNRFNGYNFKAFRSDPEKPNSISDGHINCMIEDSSGRIIIGTRNGLNLYDAKNEIFEVVLNDQEQSNSLSDNHVTALLEDSRKRIWIGTKNGLNLMDPEDLTIEDLETKLSSATGLSDNYITSLLEDTKGNLWIGSKKGLNVMDIENGTIVSFLHDLSDIFSLSSDEITKVFQDNQQQIWVGTREGLNQFDPINNKFSRFLHDPFNAKSISDNHILNIYQDSNDRLWISTANGGLNLLDTGDDAFVRYQHNKDDPKSLSNNTVWSILEDHSKNLWVGVSNSGLNFHDPRTRNFTHYRYNPGSKISLQDNAVRSILLDDQDQIWVGSFTGLTIIDRKNNASRRYRHIPGDSYSLSADYVVSLCQDYKNRIWIGTGSGLNLYQPDDDLFIRYEGNDEVSLENIEIESILQDRQHQMWIGTNKKGVFRIDLDEDKINRYDIQSDETSSNQSRVACVVQDSKNRIWLGSAVGLFLFNSQAGIFELVESDVLVRNEVTNITEDPKGRIWIGSKSGFHLFDPQTKTLQTTYHEKDGLSNAFIYGALADDTGNLWLSTNKGLNKFNPDQGTFTVYDQADGLQSDEFNGKAYHKDRYGFMYFGGVNGLSIFHPDSVKTNTDSPHVVLTDFLLFNQSVEVNDSSVLKQSLNYQKEIVLDYSQDMFAFEFATLNYKQPEKNQFAYKLEPFNEDWIYTDYKDRKAVYTRVPAGSYTFLVKASNDDGYWNEEPRSIKLTILPPWWKTWWAISIYVMMSFVIVFFIARFQWRRIELKNRLSLERKEAEQYKALDKLKTQFFSNITHEFRTPLTLIIGPSEQILRQSELDESFTRSQVELIRRNSQKFLQLINQLLDLSKLEDQQMSVELYRGDLNEIIKRIVENFQSAANQKHILLNLNSQLPVSDYLFDRDKLDKVIYNLLSNALKFTPENGTIEVTIGPSDGDINKVKLIVEDSGIGITVDKLPHIFDRFYQVEGTATRNYEGTGIGLALTKELIELQGGTIEATSEESVGMRFVIELPIKQASPTDTTEYHVHEPNAHQTFVLEEVAQIENVTIDPESEKPMVLIVEDNNDLRGFVQSILHKEFQTLIAKDGKEGITLALEHVPDLIISDVMMPEKDGFELTETIKNNSLSSHIPVILLTAKSALKSRLEGLKHGADAYLNKPFSVDELMLTVNHQIATRKLLQSKYSGTSNNENQEPVGYSKIDQELIDRLHAFIEAQLSNEELAVDELIKEVAMSHSQLYRKIKALTNFSIAGFVRNYRLGRSFELLKEGAYNVTQVADMTGFGNRRYFHKVFVEKYNKPPSEILKSAKESI